MEQTALIIVDVQNDFLPPDGSLAVPGGREVIPAIKSLLDDTGSWGWKAVVATQDYHPKEHISFASSHPDKKPLDTASVRDGWDRRVELTLWPDHCVQGTKGAEIDKELRGSFEPWKSRMKIVRKGWDKTVENYSAFEGYVTEATDPSEPPRDQRIQQVSPANADITLYLKSQGVRQVVVVGLATDFCVNYTALSAIDAGFETAVATPYVRGIDASSVDRVLDNIKSKGGVVLDSEHAVRSWVK